MRKMAAIGVAGVLLFSGCVPQGWSDAENTAWVMTCIEMAAGVPYDVASEGCEAAARHFAKEGCTPSQGLRAMYEYLNTAALEADQAAEIWCRG